MRSVVRGGPAISSPSWEYTDGVSAKPSRILRWTGSSASSSWSVTDDDVGAPESRFHASACDGRGGLWARNSGCSSCGGGSGGLTVMGEVAVAVVAVEDVRVDAVRVRRR